MEMVLMLAAGLVMSVGLIAGTVFVSNWLFSEFD